jgi:magnesium transporter
VISHRHNDVLRVLTVFSVILLPLTLIASLFGMNVIYPGEGTHAAFWVIVALMIVVVASLLGFFRFKRWL